MKKLVKYRIMLVFVALMLYSSLIPSIFLSMNSAVTLILNFSIIVALNYIIFAFKKDFKVLEKTIVPFVISIIAIFIFQLIPLKELHTFFLGYSFGIFLHIDYYAFISNCIINFSLLFIVLILFIIYCATCRQLNRKGF